MIVSGVSSRLESGLDGGGGGGASEENIGNVVSGVSSGSRVMGATTKRVLDAAPDRGYLCADEEFVPATRPRASARKSLATLERGLFIVKPLACLLLLANAGFLVSAATSPKGAISVDVKVPKEAELGSTANLRCDWSLKGGKSLYSVKWYKDDHEFFRYMPDNQERTQTFPQTGIKLDKMASNENSIRLKELTLNSSGQYKCEVSTEGPSFATEYKIGNLSIITLPKRAPQITGLSTHYAVGENVTANCTAWPSIPKATLQWTINGKSVPKEYTVTHPPLAPEPGSGTPNSLGLRLEAETGHFTGGEGTVTIRCVSYVGSKRYEAEETVHMAYVNNLRLSAGDSRSGGAADKTRPSHRQHILAVIIALLGFYVAT